MKNLLGLFGVLAAALAVADLIHGPHNGDALRTYIHMPEFICFFLFLCVADVLIFQYLRHRFNLNPWLTLFLLAFVSGILNLVLFAIVGGSFHGDGGPLSASYLAMTVVAETCFPIAVIGFVVSAVLRKKAGFSILRR